MAMSVNDFRECLTRSHAAHELPFWEHMYRQAFPGMVGMHTHEANGWWQRAGIDRSIVLATGKQILIDEKIRGRNRNGCVYEDIALEYLSNDTTNAPGWVCKPLAADYIAYVIAPLGRGYLLPVEQLQAAWRRHGDAWRQEFGEPFAWNTSYKTFFCPVPVATLFCAIGAELRFHFEAVEWED